jgi:hypothetical protein
MAPPSVPEPVDFRQYAEAASGKEKKATDNAGGKSSTGGQPQTDFEYF